MLRKKIKVCLEKGSGFCTDSLVLLGFVSVCVRARAYVRACKKSTYSSKLTCQITPKEETTSGVGQREEGDRWMYAYESIEQPVPGIKT